MSILQPGSVESRGRLEPSRQLAGRVVKLRLPGSNILIGDDHFEESIGQSSLGSFVLAALDDLLLEDGRLGEAERDLVGRQLVVAVDDGIELVLHEVDVERVKLDDLLAAAVGLDAHGAFGDVGREDL